MNLFDVYPLFDINIVKGKGCHVWDENGTEYLDLYGGHAVISIGHAHPHYVEMVSNQVATLGFYSNSVINKLQQQVAERLGKVCGYDDYSFFLINSGAEANENALKLASFYNGRTRVISFSKAFHGRTSLAVEVTNNPKIIAPINANGHITYLPLNDTEALRARHLPPVERHRSHEGRIVQRRCLRSDYRRHTRCRRHPTADRRIHAGSPPDLYGTQHGLDSR